MYVDNSPSKKYPKNLIVRNHLGGMIWQVYRIDKEIEAVSLSKNATKNGFEAITLEDYDETMTETWPDWRDTDGGKQIVNQK